MLCVVRDKLCRVSYWHLCFPCVLGTVFPLKPTPRVCVRCTTWLPETTGPVGMMRSYEAAKVEDIEQLQ